MKRKVFAGITSLSLPIIVYDNTSTTGAGLSGLTNATSGLVLEYRRQGQASWTSVTLVSKTLGTYTSGGIVASGSRAGRYEIDIPDAAVAAGSRMVEICLRGAANQHPVDIEIELDAVNYQDATAFGLSKFSDIETDTQNIQSRLPTALSGGRMDSSVGAYQTGLAPLQPTTAGRTLDVTATGGAGIDWSNVENPTHSNVLSATVINGINGVTFPDDFDKLLIEPTGHVISSVDKINNNAITASAIQGGAITAAKFAAGAIDANVLNADAATEIATAVGNLQVLMRLDSMIESDGAGQFRFDTIAVSLAGGGGGGGTDWTSNERAAIRLILGFNSSGVISLPTEGVLDAIKDKTDLITSGTVQTSLPVTAAGQIASPLVIGDDYLNSNGRAFSWTVALPTGYSVGTSTCKFGMRYEDSEGVNSFVANGTVIDAGSGNVTLRFDVPKTTTNDLRAGWYDWSVEIANATSEITPVKSGKNAEWQYKQT
jgi:hypothetical protein